MNELFDCLPLLAAVPGLGHAISTRHGGVSEGPYATLNLGGHVGDDPARVAGNRRLLAQAAGYAATELVTAQQVHGTRIVQATAADSRRGAFDWESALPEADGLLVTEPGLPVGILVADCAPVVVVDPVHRALALVHAGWRGALGRIASAAVQMLADTVGARPAELLVGVGPTLCTDCLEVGHEVGDAVQQVFGDAVLRLDAPKPHLDLRALLVADLAAAGVPPAQIAFHPACTRCQTARFFSHRGQGGHAGRFALVAWWHG